MNLAHLFLICGSLLAAVAVALGAFAAHALRNNISDNLLSAFQTGVQYQMYHALALLAIGILLRSEAAPSLHPGYLSSSGFAFLIGVLLFSGSLYIMAVTSIRWVGPITPLGGLAFIVGWLLLLTSILKTP